MCPIKEPNFFAIEGEKLDLVRPKDGMAKRWARRSFTNGMITDIEAYRALFAGVSDEVVIGEASPLYLITPKAPERIKHHLPNAKLIVILRNPVERAYSAHVLKELYGGEERVGFGQAIRDIYWGLYYTHLKRYFDIFDRAQIRIYLYDNFKTNSVGVLQDIFQFLCVSETFMPDLSVQYNAGGIPRNRVWRAFLIGLGPAKSVLKPLVPTALRPGAVSLLRSLQGRAFVKPPPLDPGARAELIQIYREDILKLQDLIQRDLSAWLE
jgi:hypothetical protein